MGVCRGASCAMTRHSKCLALLIYELTSGPRNPVCSCVRWTARGLCVGICSQCNMNAKGTCCAGTQLIATCDHRPGVRCASGSAHGGDRQLAVMGRARRAAVAAWQLRTARTWGNLGMGAPASDDRCVVVCPLLSPCAPPKRACPHRPCGREHCAQRRTACTGPPRPSPRTLRRTCWRRARDCSGTPVRRRCPAYPSSMLILPVVPAVAPCALPSAQDAWSGTRVRRGARRETCSVPDEIATTTNARGGTWSFVRRPRSRYVVQSGYVDATSVDSDDKQSGAAQDWWPHRRSGSLRSYHAVPDLDLLNH